MNAPQLQRKLGLWACVSLVIGSVIRHSIYETRYNGGSIRLASFVISRVGGCRYYFHFWRNDQCRNWRYDTETGGKYTYFRYAYREFLLLFLAGRHSLLSILPP